MKLVFLWQGGHWCHGNWNVRENEMGSWKAWNVRENELGVMENNLGEKIKILSTEFFSMLENVEIICF